MVTCECGCGAQTETAAFVPGHDQRLRTRLEAQVGGILALRSLIEAAEAYAAGRDTEETLTRKIRQLFAREH